MKDLSITYKVSLEDALAYNKRTFLKHGYKISLIVLAIIAVPGILISMFSYDVETAIYNLIIAVLIFLGITLSVKYTRAIPIAYSVISILLIAEFISLKETFPIISILPIWITSFYGLGFRQYIKYYYGGKTDVVGERTLTISEKGIYAKGQLSEGSLSWDLVTGIDQDKNYIYLFLGRSKAHIIPKRSFHGEREAEEFFVEALAFKKASIS